eukprot:scaffold36944_cov49-Attheya_sp.AAC.3
MDTQEVALSEIDEEDYTFIHADDTTAAIDFCRDPMPMKKKAKSTHNHDSLYATPPSVPAFDGVDACRYEEGLVSSMVGCSLGGPVIGLAAGLGLAYATSQHSPLDPALMTGKGSGSLSQQPRSQPMPPPTLGASVSAPTSYSMLSDSFNLGNMNGSLDPSNHFRSNQTSLDLDSLGLTPPSSRSHRSQAQILMIRKKKPAKSDAEWIRKVRHQQQLMLLLLHAVKCQYEDGACPVFLVCPIVKKLCKHIVVCKDKQCKVQHCFSSRYIVSHNKRCKDARCPTCMPVRATIRKSREKEKLRQMHETSSIAATNGS